MRPLNFVCLREDTVRYFALLYVVYPIFDFSVVADSRVFSSPSQISSIHEFCLVVQFQLQQPYNDEVVEDQNTLHYNTHLILSFESFDRNHAVYKGIFLKGVQSVRYFTQGCTVHIHNIDSYSQAKTTCDCDWKQFRKKFRARISCFCDIFQFLGRTFIPLNNIDGWFDVEYNPNDITWVFHDAYILSFNEPNILYLWWTTKTERTVDEHFPLARYIVEFLFESLLYATHFAAVIDGDLHLLCLHCVLERSNVQGQLLEISNDVSSYKELLKLGQQINKQYQGISLPTVVQPLGVDDKTVLNCMSQGQHRPFMPLQRSFKATPPELCALFVIGQSLNISFQLNTHWFSSMKSEKSTLLVRLNYGYDAVEEKQEAYRVDLNRGIILDTFCKTSIPYEFKVFVHTNRTSLSLSTALLSPCEKNIWFFVVTVSFVVCCAMNYVAWKTRERDSFSNAEVTFYALSVSLGQFNEYFKAKCLKRSSVLSTLYSLWTFFTLAFSMHYSGYFLAYLLVRTLPDIPGGLNDILTNKKFEKVPLFSTGYFMTRVDEDGGYTSYLKAKVLIPRHFYYKNNNCSWLSDKYLNLSRTIRNPSSLGERTFSEQEYFYNLTFNAKRIQFDEPYDYLEETGLYAFLEPRPIVEKYESLALLSKSYERVTERKKTNSEKSIDIDPYGKTFYYQKGLCTLSIHKILSWVDNTGLFLQWNSQYDFLNNLESQRKYTELLEKNPFSSDLFLVEIPPLNSETLQEIGRLCGYVMIASLVNFLLETLSRILQKRLPKLFLIASKKGLHELILSVKSYLKGYSTYRY